MAGTLTTSTSQELSTSGMPVVVYGVTIVSDVANAGLLIMRGGVNGDADPVMALTGTVNDTLVVPWPDIGVMFPNGCYLDMDGHVVSATITFKRV